MSGGLCWAHRLMSVLIVSSLACSLPACTTDEDHFSQAKTPRCASDGLCWQAIDQRSFQGAFRQQDQELQFDIVFSPAPTLFAPVQDEWSFRIYDTLGNCFFEALSSHPPDSWLLSHPARWPHPRAQEKAHLFARMAMIREMAHAVLATEGPLGPGQKPWRQLQHYLRESMGMHGPTVHVSKHRRKAARVSLRLPRTPSLAFVPDTAVRADASRYSTAVFTGEALLDDFQPHEELSKGVSAQRSLALGVASSPLAIAGSDGLSFSFSNPLYVARPVRFPAEITSVPGKEFQQDIDLYWKPTRSFFHGTDTKKHHTAACIKLKQRDLGSNDTWELVQEVCTASHGFQAGSESMVRYAQCRDLPVTKEYYAWKGECGSGYPKHFCNDDTALQIWHAHGEWDGGKHCATTYRTRRPLCDKPW